MTETSKFPAFFTWDEWRHVVDRAELLSTAGSFAAKLSLEYGAFIPVPAGLSSVSLAIAVVLTVFTVRVVSFSITPDPKKDPPSRILHGVVLIFMMVTFYAAFYWAEIEWNAIKNPEIGELVRNVCEPLLLAASFASLGGLIVVLFKPDNASA